MYLNPQTIELDGLPDLIALTRYKPNTKKLAGEGFLLAEDLLSKDSGGILYAKGMELDYEKIERLLRISEKNPDWKLSFSIQKNEKLYDTLAKRIREDFDRLIESRRGRQEYRKLMDKVQGTIENQYNEIVSSDEIVYLLVQAKFTEITTNKEGATPLYNNLIHSALVTIGIFQQAFQVTNFKFTKEDIIHGAQAALLHGIGGIETTPLYKDKPAEEREIRYQEGIGNSAAVAQRIGLPEMVVQSIQKVAAYQDGQKAFLESDKQEDLVASVVTTSVLFNFMVLNPFADPGAAKGVVDKMYVLAAEGDLKKMMVDALAKGLKFDALFDFYAEIEKLNRSCPYGHGQAYPLTGFKSPVIYICKGNLDTCQHYATSAKAVTIFRKTGGLEEGQYGRCKWLSNSLIKFYDEFYEQIKEETLSKDER